MTESLRLRRLRNSRPGAGVYDRGQQFDNCVLLCGIAGDDAKVINGATLGEGLDRVLQHRLAGDWGKHLVIDAALHAGAAAGREQDGGVHVSSVQPEWTVPRGRDPPLGGSGDRRQ